MTDNLIACGTAGRVSSVEAREGQSIAAGDPILVVEAAGRRVVVDTPVSGTVKTLYYAADETLPEASVIAVIET